MQPERYIKRKLNEISPNYTEEEIKNTLKLIEHKRQNDQFCLLQDNVLDKEKGGQLSVYVMAPNFEISLFLAQATGSILITDSEFRWAEIKNAQHRNNGFLINNRTELTSLINEKKYPLIIDCKAAFQIRSKGKTKHFREAMRSIFLTASSDAKTDNLKYQFNRAYENDIKNLSIITNSSFDRNIECLIPKGGIVCQNVQRLLLSRDVKNYSKNLSMAMFISNVWTKN